MFKPLNIGLCFVFLLLKNSYCESMLDYMWLFSLTDLPFFLSPFMENFWFSHDMHFF